MSPFLYLFGCSQRKKKRKPLTRELALDMNENNTDGDTPRQRLSRMRSQSAQRRLPSTTLDMTDSGIPPKPRKKRSKTAEDVLSNDDLARSSRSAPRLAKTMSRERLLDQEKEEQTRTPNEKKGGKRKQKINHTERTV